jgi:hypothetical protein
MSEQTLELIHPVTGKLKELTMAQFLAEFNPDIHEAIGKVMAKLNTKGMVLFENMQMDSSRFAEKSALMVGGESLPDWEAVTAPGCRLGDVPSRFKYPVAFWRKGL